MRPQPRRASRRRQAALRFLQDPAGRRRAESAARGPPRRARRSRRCRAGPRPIGGLAAGRCDRRRRRRSRRRDDAIDCGGACTRRCAVGGVAAIDHGAKAPQPGNRYWLQAGSFTGESDAENLKAQARVRRPGGDRAAGRPSGQERPLPRPARARTTTRRARPDESRAVEARIRRRRRQVLKRVRPSAGTWAHRIRPNPLPRVQSPASEPVHDAPAPSLWEPT